MIVNLNTRTILVAYYGATAVFLVLDYAAGLNVRVAFLESLPMARAAYYAVCFTCLALMLWRPGWTVLIGAFESLVTLSALLVSTGVRVLLATDHVLETGAGAITRPEILNFMISGCIAYMAWVQGVSRLKNAKNH